jgi:hypothetical protein
LERLYLKKYGNQNRADGVFQVVEHLLGKHEAPGSNPSTTSLPKKTKKLPNSKTYGKG